uniref:Polynucleotide adenylyltransferase n=1 Tax=Meloidogyne javanica TaxID=6303 RepID=A0A915N456_MELJA
MDGWRQESLILISGSYIFKSLTPESDIDMIVLLPNYEKISEINLQYTNNLVFNVENSLYNIIRRLEGVTSLFKVGGRVPLLKLVYYGYDFDLLFVGVPCHQPFEFLQDWTNPILLESLVYHQQQAQQSNFISIKNLLNWDINSDYNRRRQHRLMQHAKRMWPIIAPGNPPQNSGFNINYSTSRILLSEMRLDGVPFEEKYEHFMAITSINLSPNNSNNQIFEEFNNFVETRIRLGLVFNIENISEIDYCHAKPGRVWNNEKCPSIITEKNINNE